MTQNTALGSYEQQTSQWFHISKNLKSQEAMGLGIWGDAE